MERGTERGRKGNRWAKHMCDGERSGRSLFLRFPNTTVHVPCPWFFCLFTPCFDPPIPSQVVLVLCFVLWRFFWMCSLCFLYILITVFDLFYWVGLRFEPNPTYSILDSTYFILITRSMRGWIPILREIILYF